MQRFAILLVVAFLEACSAAGWKGYGPRGDGFIGSAYGYEQSQIGERTFFVSYVDNTMVLAVEKFHRRARELCSGIGLASYDVTSSIAGVNEPSRNTTSIIGGVPIQSSTGGIPTYSGYVVCKAEGAPVVGAVSAAPTAAADTTPSITTQIVTAIEAAAAARPQAPARSEPSGNAPSPAGAAPPRSPAPGAAAPQPTPAPAAPGSSMARIPQAPSAGATTTRIMVYMTSAAHGAITVSIDDVVQGGLITALAPGQSCGADDAITVTVRPGTHRLFARSTLSGSQVSWGPVDRTVAAGDCYIWRLDGRAQSGGAVVGARPDDGVSRVAVVFWTRRSLSSEGIDVFVDGRVLTPANWSFAADPTDCQRMPVFAIREYRPGETFTIQTRASLSRDSGRPLLSSNQVTLPSVACYFYEIR